MILFSFIADFFFFIFASLFCTTLIYLIKQCALAKLSRLGIMELKGIFNFKKSSTVHWTMYSKSIGL